MIDNKILIIIAALIMIICILTGFIIATQTIPHETNPAANTTKNITKNKTHVNATINNTNKDTEPTSSSTEDTQTKNSTEGEYGGFTKEEAIYREGLVDGHRQAEQALLNDRSSNDIPDKIANYEGDDSSNVETTTDSGSSSDSGSSNVETTTDSGSSNEAVP